MSSNIDSRPLVGLIPAAGRGTRLAPFPCPKELFPIGYQEFRTSGGIEKRPKVISQYLIENILLAGAKRIFVILGESKYDIARYYGDGRRFGFDLAYLYQERLNGMPGALDLAWPWIGGEEVDVLFGMPDTIIEPHDAFAKLYQHHLEKKADLTLGLFPTDNPSKFGMVEVDDCGRVLSTIDKPHDTSLTHMWGLACWGPAFTSLLNQFVKEQSECGNETVLGDAFNLAIRQSLNVSSFSFESGLYMDIGTSDELNVALQRFHL